MSDLSRKTALVWDGGGLFPFMAEMLATKFGTVYYFAPSTDAFPLARKALWGEGLPGVERVADFFDVLDASDIVVFPDVGAGDLQAWLRSQGKAVWGSGQSEVLEQDRVALKRWQQAQGLPMPDTTILSGMDALREYLQNPTNENQFIKISEYRGEGETFHHTNFWLSEPWLNALDHQLGPMRNRMNFVAEGAIENSIEPGYDGFTVDGAYPSIAVVAYENKDIAYIGRVIPASEIPTSLQQVNDAIAPFFKATQCRSIIGMEVRVTPDGVGYLIDVSLRTTSPPSESLMELFSNWPEIIDAAATDGTLTEPVPTGKYSAQIVLRSEWAVNGFLALRFPEEYRKLIKLHGHAIVDGTDYVVSLDMDIIGSAVGIGDTMEEATAQALEVAGSIEGQQLTYDAHGFEPIYESIHTGEQRGIPWG